MKKGKNDILYIHYKRISETHNKKIISILDNIDGDLNKIYFCNLGIDAKIIKNPSVKPMSEIITKLGKMHIDL